MNTPLHFRFLIDHVETVARETPSVLYSDSRTFWDDILETCDQRDEKKSYWLFCTRWVRESLLKVMRGDSAKALVDVLKILKPETEVLEPETLAGKRRTIAHLLPILMIETLMLAETATVHRYGENHEDAPPSCHPRDH